MCTETRGVRDLELEIQVVVSNWMRLMRAELRISERCSLATEPSHWPTVLGSLCFHIVISSLVCCLAFMVSLAQVRII